MKNIKKAMIALLLCASFVGMASCKNPQNTGTEDSSSPEAAYTAYNLVSGGKTDYKLVVADDADKSEKYAISEFTYFFKEATGITLECVTDQGKTHDKNNRYVCIGDNDLFRSADLGFEKSALQKDEVRVETKDQSIYVIGGGTDGTLYAVYELLEDLFHYDFFFTDAYYIDKGVSDVKLKDYSIVSVPDFSYRLPNTGYTWDNYETAKRMRFDDRFDGGLLRVGNKENGVTYTASNHNSFVFLPPFLHYGEHPEWYSTAMKSTTEPAQLCYTAHGDAESYELMLQEVMEVAKTNFIADQESTVLSISIQDIMAWCECPACSADYKTYGTYSASVIKFLNDLNVLVKEWFTGDGKAYARDYKLAFLAYYNTVAAPAKLKTGSLDEYEPVAPEVKADPEIAVIYAPIEGDFSRTIDDPNSTNTTIYHNMLKWSAVCDHLMMWSYSTMYSDYLMPIDTFNAIQGNYQFYKDMNVFWMFNQGQTSQANSASGWLILKTYLDSKLEWDVDADMNYYIDKFFTYYFEDASDAMRDYFESYRIHWQVLREDGFNNAMSAYWGARIKRAELWQKPTLLNWHGKCEEALESIEYLRIENPDKYNLLRERILTERVSVNYMLVLFYERTSAAGDVALWKTQFKDDVSLIGLSHADEGNPISAVFENFGV